MPSTIVRNLASALILYEKIDTTEARAKEVKPYLEHLLFVAREDTVHARRQLKRHLFHPNAVRKVFEVIAPNLQSLKSISGFLQMYRIGRRTGDGAEKVRLIIDPRLTEPIQNPQETKKPTKPQKK